MANIPLKIISKKQLQLEVPRLVEWHPFVRKGHHVYLQRNGEREPIKYGADIEEVINTSFWLVDFSSKLMVRLQEDPSMWFDLEFTSNRFPVCTMHQADDLLL
jgi:hypothetical protein